ncbi:MAG: hypothetical protein HPZ79_03040 [Oscillospiraceae bacterium]|nr:hypothetical protein [Oscillospiraceae bacterium]
MDKKVTSDQLIIPVYLNEKTVLDMLAIIEDGFSMVSEVTSSSQDASSSTGKLSGGVSTKAILDKLLKIQLEGSFQKDKSTTSGVDTKLEKVHTNVSLLSKFRSELIAGNLLTCKAGDNLDISNINAGDFIEIEGELQKNPMIDIMEKFIDVFRMADIFTDKPQLGSKKASSEKKATDNVTVRQMQSFLNELKHTGTVDFILESRGGTAVLSAQEQYLANDNISELIGGTFKVLGKIIRVCKEDEDGINLLRKTTLNILDNTTREQFLSMFKAEELAAFNLPDVRFIIAPPAVIIIPVAIYA